MQHVEKWKFISKFYRTYIYMPIKQKFVVFLRDNSEGSRWFVIIIIMLEGNCQHESDSLSPFNQVLSEPGTTSKFLKSACVHFLLINSHAVGVRYVVLRYVAILVFLYSAKSQLVESHFSQSLFWRLKNCYKKGSNICGFMKIGLRKLNFFGVKEFFSWILISIMSVKMNLRIITKNHAAETEIGFLAKLISSRMASQRPCR